jgi:NAD(P)-dependent dehydrogenase (short-subunit alcohol dehydrogenase family)
MAGERALVIGGTGPTGPYVVEGLDHRGFDVTILHGGQHEVDFAVGDVAGGGKIIVLGSAASRRAGAGLAHYASTKAAVSALVRVAARDLRGDRIAVNELQPGPTATAMDGVEESDPDTLAEREVVLSGEGLEDDQTVAGEWFKSPRNVAEFALYLATLPNHGPSGQIFSYNSPV